MNETTGATHPRHLDADSSVRAADAEKQDRPAPDLIADTMSGVVADAPGRT